LLEQLRTSVKTVSTSCSSIPSICPSKQKTTPLINPSQKIQAHSPKSTRSNNSFKAKSYFSLADDSKQHHQKTNQISNVSNNVTMAAAKIINLKRNSVNLAQHGQFSIDALKTKTKEFISGVSLFYYFS
jgi:hypothetical protein